MPTQSFSSKTTQPRTHQVLLRDRLLTELNEAHSHSPLIWLSAPGGSGKTTLINSYLSKTNKKNIWYQIDEGDTDPATLFHYLKLSASKLSAKDAIALPALTAEYMPGISNFTRRFMDTLAAILNPHGCIVFDNLHLLAEDSIFYTLLPVMVDSMQPGQTIIIISRQQPPASLVSLKASQKLVHISEQSLRFDEKEWCDIAALLGNQIENDYLLELHSRSNGWISGLILGLSDLNSSSNKNKTLSSSSFSYFAEEILNKHSKENQQSLLTLSYLPYISQTSASSITNNPDIISLINQMSENNQFITLYEDDRYILHPLFQEFLQQEMSKQFSEDEINNTLLLTAELLQSDANYFSAISLYFKSGHDDKAIALICEKASAIIASGQVSQLSQALEKIPDEIKNNNAQLCFINASLYAMSNPDSAIEHFVKSCELFIAEQKITAAYESLLSAIKQITTTLHCFELLPSLLDKFTELQTHQPLPDDLSEKDLISILMSAYFITDYDREKVYYWISRCEQAIELNADPAQTVELSLSLLLIYFNECNSEKIVKTIDFILPFLNKDHMPPFIFLASHFSILFSWLHVMDIEKGHQLTHSLIKLAKESEINALDSFLLIAEAKFELFMGRHDSVKDCLDKLYPLCRGDRNYLSNYYYLQSQYYMWQDDYTEALKSLTLSKQAIGDGNPFAWRIVLDDMHAELLFLIGDYEQSSAFNDRTVKEVEGFPNHGVFAHGLMLKALLADKSGDTETARTALTKAIRHIKEHKLMRFSNWYPSFISQVAHFSFLHNIEAAIMKQWISKHLDYLPAPALSISQWPWPIKIYTLGKFEVLVNGRNLFAETRRDARPILLLKALIKHSGKASVASINDELYPELSADKQKTSLHTHLHRLRQLLNSDQAILRESDNLQLNPKFCWSDDAAFSALLTDNSNNPDTKQQALQLYQGEYLKGEEEDFDVLIRKEQLRAEYLRTITELIHELEQQQLIQQAIELSQQAIKIEPLSETLYQNLIKLYLQQNRPDLAKACFEQCRRTLLSYLEIEPTQATLDLIQL
ncbi:MAG: hypothetical protein OEY36_10150 [Gammaproteobacteria bacterium]|nr:hypothetical protein [Gammaproteobacteria bacterium]